MPAATNLQTLPTTLTAGQQSYRNTLDALAAKYGESPALPVTPQRPKKKKRKRPKKITAKNITPAQEELIASAVELQVGAKRRGKKKFDIAKFVKKPSYPRVKGTLKRAPQKRKASFDKRTTLLSLMRKIPDAKKPISTWLK